MPLLCCCDLSLHGPLAAAGDWKKGREGAHHPPCPCERPATHLSCRRRHQEPRAPPPGRGQQPGMAPSSLSRLMGPQVHTRAPAAHSWKPGQEGTVQGRGSPLWDTLPELGSDWRPCKRCLSLKPRSSPPAPGLLPRRKPSVAPWLSPWPKQAQWAVLLPTRASAISLLLAPWHRPWWMHGHSDVSSPVKCRQQMAEAASP